jgi:hypothetical protein
MVRCGCPRLLTTSRRFHAVAGGDFDAIGIRGSCLSPLH